MWSQFDWNTSNFHGTFYDCVVCHAIRPWIVFASLISFWKFLKRFIKKYIVVDFLILLVMLSWWCKLFTIHMKWAINMIVFSKPYICVLTVRGVHLYLSVIDILFFILLIPWTFGFFLVIQIVWTVRRFESVTLCQQGAVIIALIASRLYAVLLVTGILFMLLRTSSITHIRADFQENIDIDVCVH